MGQLSHEDAHGERLQRTPHLSQHEPARAPRARRLDRSAIPEAAARIQRQRAGRSRHLLRLVHRKQLGLASQRQLRGDCYSIADTVHRQQLGLASQRTRFCVSSSAGYGFDCMITEIAC